MNVAFGKWIPVINLKGKPEIISLYETLTQGDKYLDLSVRPHERVSLLKLLLCISHSALNGPKDYSEWKDVLEYLFERNSNYLETWKDSFELFHSEKPWLQIPSLTKEPMEWTPVSKLFTHLATGANSTLFDHDGMDNENRHISLENVILSMLTFQNFSVGGLISQVFWGEGKTNKSAKDAPCAPSSMMHGFLRGKNIKETIYYNLLSFEDISSSEKNQDMRWEIGKPIWEMFPYYPNDVENIKNATTTYLGRMVPLSRAIRLSEDGTKMLFGEGLIYPTFYDGFLPEPTATIIKREKNKKEGNFLLSYRPSKNIWRELGSIIVEKKSYNGVGGPLFLMNYRDHMECDLVVSSLARNKSSIVDTAESVFNINPNLKSEHGINCYLKEVSVAEHYSSLLGWGIETYRKTIDSGWEGRVKMAGPSSGELKAKLKSTANIIFWTNVEKNLGILMNHINSINTEQSEPTMKIWRGFLFNTAKNTFKIVCSDKKPREQKAFVLGLQKIYNKKEEKTNE